MLGLIWDIFFGALVVIARGIDAVVSAVVKIVVGAVRAAARMATSQAIGGDPLLDEFIWGHVRWRKALTSQEAADREVERLLHEMDDADGNGVPDLYDAEITTPEADFLHIKFPTLDNLLIENDYVRYMPRVHVDLPQPVAVGGKGLVRSETLTNMGQYVWIKYNALNPRGPAEAPLYRCNAMDLYKLGHVSGAQLTR